MRIGKAQFVEFLVDEGVVPDWLETADSCFARLELEYLRPKTKDHRGFDDAKIESLRGEFDFEYDPAATL